MLKNTILLIPIFVFLSGITSTEEMVIKDDTNLILNTNSCVQYISSEYLSETRSDLQDTDDVLLQYYQIFGTQFCTGDCPIIINGVVCCRVVVPDPEPDVE